MVYVQKFFGYDNSFFIGISITVCSRANKILACNLVVVTSCETY